MDCQEVRLDDIECVAQCLSGGAVVVEHFAVMSRTEFIAGH